MALGSKLDVRSRKLGRTGLRWATTLVPVFRSS
jgi:hypothetical protein